MKHLATLALMLNLGVAGIYAQQRPRKDDAGRVRRLFRVEEI